MRENEGSIYYDKICTHCKKHFGIRELTEWKFKKRTHNSSISHYYCSYTCFHAKDKATPNRTCINPGLECEICRVNCKARRAEYEG